MSDISNFQVPGADAPLLPANSSLVKSNYSHVINAAWNNAIDIYKLTGSVVQFRSILNTVNSIVSSPVGKCAVSSLMDLIDIHFNGVLFKNPRVHYAEMHTNEAFIEVISNYSHNLFCIVARS